MELEKQQSDNRSRASLTPPPCVAGVLIFPGDSISDRPPPRVRPPTPRETLPTITVANQRSRKPQTAGLFSSMILHAMLIGIIALLVAPADFGGVNAIVIAMSWSDHDSEEVSPLDFTTFESEVAVVGTPELAIVPIPAPSELNEPMLSAVSADAANQSGFGGGGSGANGERGAGAGGPQGTFFGIEASGHEFVYVVDMSGSMRGHLYDRAVAELIRSVGKLQPSQKFYVTLFSDEAKPMFDETSLRPTSVFATPENTERLAEWLLEAYDGGGTDPRAAVKLALDMRPSAIFMLSDGKFQERRNPNASVLLATDASTTANLVKTAHQDVPIHSIAFENLSSRTNMQQLANLSAGTFRFVKADQASRSIEEALTEIQDADGRQQGAVSQVLWNDLIDRINLESMESEQRDQTVKVLIAQAESACQNRNPSAVMKILDAIVRLDPQATYTFAQQQRLVTQCHDLQTQTIELESGLSVTNSYLSQAQIVARYPDAKISQMIRSDLMERLVAQAERKTASGDVATAYGFYNQIASVVSDAQLRREAIEKQKGIVEQQLEIARELESEQGIRATVIYLTDTFHRCDSSWMRYGGRDALYDASMRLHGELRDATASRDYDQRQKIRADIEFCFAKSSIFKKAATDFVRNDRRATGILNDARRQDQNGNRQLALERYQTIVENFGYSRAAPFAQKRLVALTGTPLPTALSASTDSDVLKGFDELMQKDLDDRETAVEVRSENTLSNQGSASGTRRYPETLLERTR